VAVGLLVALAALAGAEVVDGEVGDDAVDPGVGAPAGVEAGAVVPHAEEGDLDDVAGFFEVAEDAVGDLEEGGGLALDELVEGALVAPAQAFEDFEVGGGVPPLALVALAVDEPGHRYRQGRFLPGCLRRRSAPRLGSPLPGAHAAGDLRRAEGIPPRWETAL